MTDGRLRLLSANLLNGRADPTTLVGYLRDLDIHVAALQELGPEQADAVAEILPHGKLEPAEDYNGGGIALRHPGDVSRLPLLHRDARVARLSPGEWPGLPGLLEVVSVHIQAPHNTWPWITLGRRLDQVRALRAYLDATPMQRRMLVGDFNATPLWPAYQVLTRHLPDAVLEHARRNATRARRTWRPVRFVPRLLRLDHVLAEGVQLERVEVLDVPGTDHAAIFTEFTFPKAG